MYYLSSSLECWYWSLYMIHVVLLSVFVCSYMVLHRQPWPEDYTVFF